MKEIRMLILLFIGMCLISCSEGNDQTEQSSLQENGQVKSFAFKLARNTVENSMTPIKDFGVYAYVKDALVATASGVLSNEVNSKIELPLDESVTLFAFANTDLITSSDTLSKTQVHIGNQGQNEVYMSGLVGMVSDNSVDTVHFELNRIVGQMVFQPTESEAILNAISQFDAIDIVFINVGTAYLPKTNSSIQGSITIRTTKADGFKAAVYSFPTFTGSAGTMEVLYYKNGQLVNKTIRALDVAINVEPSKQSVVYMSLLDENYLENLFSKSSSSKKSSATSNVTLKEYQF